MEMADDGPRIVRPVPRRPFNLNLTPPEDNELEWQGSRDAADPVDSAAPSMPRPSSCMNLTSSTLMGIYSQAASEPDREEMDTPWGTGAQTPIRRPSVDDATYELMRDRSHLPRRPSMHGRVDAATTAYSLAPRAALLFLLGVGYGVLVSRLHSEQQYLANLAEGIIKPGTNWKYLAFWGVTGVILGSLLPWFDKVWEGGGEGDYAAGALGEASADKGFGPGPDWALVMRAIGAFVGIIFAIRKLAWASTLQVSATLALVNPLLWWLIDRSKPGLVLSTAVGLTGTMLLLGVNPEMMPAPSRMASSARGGGLGNASSSTATAAVTTRDGTVPLAFGGLARQETIETGVWMVSVLFCSCVCFGNIGRRLAWSRQAVGRGRWGDVR